MTNPIIEEVRAARAALAAEHGIITAAAEKLAALSTVDYLGERAKSGRLQGVRAHHGANPGRPS